MAVGRCAIPRFDQAASGSAINGGQVHLSDGSTSPARQLPAPWPGDAGAAAEGRAGVCCRGNRLPHVSDVGVSHRFDHRPAGVGAGGCRAGAAGAGLAVDDPGQLAAAIDRIVAVADPDAVRQVRERARDREVSIWNSADGMGEVYAQLYATDAQALDARLNALVATVCAGDPRSTDQRRADALGALAAGADRLACRCDNPDCAAEGRPVSAVVIHVVAEQASVKGHGQAPAALLGGDGLIPAELVAELAKTAGLQPIPVPAGTEPGYRPSVKLAAFVRARDLTCRAPGCDRPATQCDLDHTIAFADGGATHAANLECLCRLHHLLATFCGWRAQQLPDGTVIWTLPGDQTYVTTPGSALLFPALCTPTGDPPAPDPARADRRGQRTAMMPRRASTRTQNRAHCIAAERHRNHQARRIAQAAVIATETHGPPPDPDDDPPPF
ncbi:13E12 repeat family protein [Mycobacterium tuberculosis SUMu002]|nr:13E12 repeat family protein [Mycobacterium tuberculosis SUMu002]